MDTWIQVDGSQDFDALRKEVQELREEVERLKVKPPVEEKSPFTKFLEERAKE